MGTMTTYKNYHLRIWDRLGFQEGETGWVIEVTEPHQVIGGGDEVGEIILSNQEAEQLGLEQEMGDWDIWDRDITVSLSSLIDNYDVPQRVYDFLEAL